MKYVVTLHAEGRQKDELAVKVDAPNVDSAIARAVLQGLSHSPDSARTPDNLAAIAQTEYVLSVVPV